MDTFLILIYVLCWMVGIGSFFLIEDRTKYILLLAMLGLSSFHLNYFNKQLKSFDGCLQDLHKLEVQKYGE